MCDNFVRRETLVTLPDWHGCELCRKPLNEHLWVIYENGAVLDCKLATPIEVAFATNSKMDARAMKRRSGYVRV